MYDARWSDDGWRNSVVGLQSHLIFCSELQAATATAELSIGRVDPWVGLGWVEIFQFFVGWVGSTIAKVLKIGKDC